MNKSQLKNGFTVLEMMIVMLVIALLLLITLPNIQQKEGIIRAKGCSALLEIVNSQIILYEVENSKTPDSIAELIAGGYLKEEQATCPDQSAVQIVNGQAVSN
jgi:competence protein ComGC